MIKDVTKYKMALIDGVLRHQDKPIQIKKVAQLIGLSGQEVSQLWWRMVREYHAPIMQDTDGIYYTVSNYTIGMDCYLTQFSDKIEKAMTSNRRSMQSEFTENDRQELMRNIEIAEKLAIKERDIPSKKEQEIKGRWILRMRTETNKYFVGNAKRGYPIVSTDRKKAFVFETFDQIKKAKAMLYGQFEEVTE